MSTFDSVTVTGVSGLHVLTGATALDNGLTVIPGTAANALSVGGPAEFTDLVTNTGGILHPTLPVSH